MMMLRITLAGQDLDFSLVSCYCLLISCPAGYVTFHTPHLSVTEGNDAIVCVQLIGLNDSTQLGCDIAVTLTLIAGIAGTFLL